MNSKNSFLYISRQQLVSFSLICSHVICCISFSTLNIYWASLSTVLPSVQFVSFRFQGTWIKVERNREVRAVSDGMFDCHCFFVRFHNMWAIYTRFIIACLWPYRFSCVSWLLKTSLVGGAVRVRKALPVKLFPYWDSNPRPLVCTPTIIPQGLLGKIWTTFHPIIENFSGLSTTPSVFKHSWLFNSPRVLLHFAKGKIVCKSFVPLPTGIQNWYLLCTG